MWSLAKRFTSSYDVGMDACLLLTEPVSKDILLHAFGEVEGVDIAVDEVPEWCQSPGALHEEFQQPARMQVWLYDMTAQDEELWGRGLRTAIERLARVIPGDFAVGLDVGTCLLVRKGGVETLHAGAWYNKQLAGASTGATKLAA